MSQTVDAEAFRTHPHERALPAPRQCGHARHVGTCPSCQRAQLARWNAQLAAITRPGGHR